MLIDSSVINYFTNEMVFAKINAEKDDSTVAKEFNVKGYPTFILIDPQGNEVDRYPGYLPPIEFLEMINDYKAGIGTLDDLLTQAKDSVDRELYFMIADKYKYKGMPDDARVWYKKIIAEGQPTDSMSGESFFAMADMFLRDKQYDEAIDAFEELKKDFKGQSFEEVAGIYIPYVYMKKGDTTNAISNFEIFIKNFPESEDVEFAQTKIKELKGETEH